MHEFINLIKADLRSMMNGVASAAMREAGMTADYRVNFGVELPRLQLLADEIRTEHADVLPQLAQELWKESVRECRILATMVQPAETFTPDLADVWAERIRTVELAQIAALHLFARMPGAADKAFEWVAAADDLRQILGYYTLLHIIRRRPLAERSRQELLDQATAAAASDNTQLRLAARRMLDRLGNV